MSRLALVVVAVVLCAAGLVVADVAGAPLILTNYLSDPAKGRSLSAVTDLGWKYPSYSGYFSVDKPSLGSNLFFWFFPAQNGDENAPLIMWLNGGPGSSSMYGLFAENGPFSVDSNLNLVARDSTWNQQFAMVFVDNPVGTGYSFTQSTAGLATNEYSVAGNLYSMLQQFFTIFPDYRDNDFYISAESYGGKYGPATAYEILLQNKNTTNPIINLKGLTVGDGMMDPVTQTQGYADMWYNLGLVDYDEQLEARVYEERVEGYILQQDYLDAFFVFDKFLNGDFYPYPTFYNNVTGLYDYYNFDTPDYPPNPYPDFLSAVSTRSAIHVGDNVFWDYNMTVDQYMQDDWMRSVRGPLAYVMDHIKVMIYNGQFDIILPPPMAEAFLRTLVWSGEVEYLKASKIIWHVDGQVAGYVRHVKQFTQAIVRQGGHLLPQDQPERCLDMITRFILDQPFN